MRSFNGDLPPQRSNRKQRKIGERRRHPLRNKPWKRKRQGGVSQPTLRRDNDVRLTGAFSKEGKRAESPPMFILRKMLEKPKCGLRTLSVKDSGVIFTHGEGISTPRVRHKGR